MASRLILHIGLQKSGTTYLQELIASGAGELAKAGVVYPVAPAGRRRRRTENHEWASYGLLGSEYPWVSEQRAADEKGAWKILERQVARTKGTVLLSAEALSVIRTSAIRTLLDRLAVRDVEIVVTARGLNRSLPSLWQQHVRNGRRLGFERYLDMLGEQRRMPAARIEEDLDLHLWRAFAVGRLARRWAREVGESRVRVVTSPGRPPELLWARFAEAIGVPGFTFRAGDAERPVHTGLTAPEAVVLTSLNAALASAGWPSDRARRLREAVLSDGFQPRTERGPRIAIPAHWRSCVAEWSAEDVADLLDSGVTVIGDPADLRPEPAREDVPAPTIEEVGAACAAAVLAVNGKAPGA
ncbi:hypothetical protein [Actinoallomurus acaciae]|uniref:Sulfotransferase family protein n=1 Tax=Actinoallomurus acaciae TaxID=502577 RepID=A0ABV5YDY2_9ACTN